MKNLLQNNPRWIDGRKASWTYAYKIYKLPKKCNRCGETKGRIHVHHKNKNRLDNSRKNLEILCVKCHNIHHKKNQPSPRKNYHHSEKTRRKISLSGKGKHSGKDNGFYGKSWLDYGGHPKGMLGKKHSRKTLKKISEASKRMWKKRRILVK